MNPNFKYEYFVTYHVLYNPSSFGFGHTRVNMDHPFGEKADDEVSVVNVISKLNNGAQIVILNIMRLPIK